MEFKFSFDAFNQIPNYYTIPLIKFPATIVPTPSAVRCQTAEP